MTLGEQLLVMVVLSPFAILIGCWLHTLYMTVVLGEEWDYNEQKWVKR